MTWQDSQPITIRRIDPGDVRQIDTVADRMRATLTEVLGAEGFSMYSLDWLRERVRWHLKPEECTGSVLLAQARAGEVIGHIILRVEDASSLMPLGLISTIYVDPPFRRSGVAQALLDAGEAWLVRERAATLATDTSETNTPLIQLFEKRGYKINFRSPEKRMIRLSRRP